jgi:type II secretory ATPase GspE/PulE/Tfp pilus assembly ATPase PilB-like protein
MGHFLHQRKDNTTQPFQVYLAPSSPFIEAPSPPLVGENSRSKPLKFGEWLLSQKWITTDQLVVALKEQAHSAKRIGELMVDLGFISKRQLREALSALSGLPFVSLANQILDASIVHQIPHHLATGFLLILFDQDERGYHIAMADPENLVALDKVRLLLGTEVPLHAYHATRGEIAEALEICYPQMTVDTNETEAIRLVNDIILEAVRLKASDIHLSPTASRIDVHYRQDGLLHQTHTLHKDRWPAICVRLKIMGSLDIAESRRPQNGRFSLTVGGREIDFRLSCHPTIHGENLVLRILDKSQSLRSLDALGFREEDREKLINFVNLPQGLILLSGPTGSGKTTTLYALLNHMDVYTRNIMTLEEPVEYLLPNIHQTEIREGGPFRFADGVRSLLRQDPDVIFISEIRDSETAQMALRATMTGHLVLGTIHATDCLTIPKRLQDLGIAPSLLNGNLIAGISQRLVRRLCKTCRYPEIVTFQERTRYSISSSTTPIYQPGGCASCHQTGYQGREAVAELVVYEKDFSSNIQRNLPQLWERAVEKVLEGKTTFAEIERVIGAYN